MLRLIALGCALLIAGPQEPAGKVDALVAKLSSEELFERDAAATELAKLGPPAIPAIRGHISKSNASVQALLKSVLRRIERDERVASLARPGPRVTLTAKDRSPKSVLQE